MQCTIYIKSPKPSQGKEPILLCTSADIQSYESRCDRLNRLCPSLNVKKKAMGLLREKEALRVEGDKNRQWVLALRWSEGTLVLDPPRLHRDDTGTPTTFLKQLRTSGQAGRPLLLCSCNFGNTNLLQNRMFIVNIKLMIETDILHICLPLPPSLSLHRDHSFCIAFPGTSRTP